MKRDNAIFDIIARERQRQMKGIELIASENFVSDQVMEAMGSCLTNKYAEGYPGKRYYGGCEVVDQSEQLAIDRLKEIFGAEWANVQPHSGAQANMAVFMAVLNPGDKFLGLNLSHGGHLSHGSPVNFSGLMFQPLEYGVKEDTGYVDYDMMEEVFRSVRTNVQYMLEEGCKVVLFTSTVSGEGKSFNAGNLATSFAYMGKKTVIVGLDIRRPGLNKVFNIPRSTAGITQYLASPGGTDLMSLCQKSDISDNLYILPGGIVPPNPTELVSRHSLDDAIDILKKNFDYIIIDSAPIGMVTDTQIISRVADMVVYVCRSGFTPKSDFKLVNQLVNEGKLKHVGVLINGIDMNRRNTGYYYGYGKYGRYGKYGYGKRYGYGYGYGYGKDKN